jgi:hypothetical protein
MRLAARRAAPSYLNWKPAILQKAHANYCHLQIFTNMKLAETSKVHAKRCFPERGRQTHAQVTAPLWLLAEPNRAAGAWRAR